MFDNKRQTTPTNADIAGRRLDALEDGARMKAAQVLVRFMQEEESDLLGPSIGGHGLPTEDEQHLAMYRREIGGLYES